MSIHQLTRYLAQFRAPVVRPQYTIPTFRPVISNLSSMPDGKHLPDDLKKNAERKTQDYIKKLEEEQQRQKKHLKRLSEIVDKQNQHPDRNKKIAREAPQPTTPPSAKKDESYCTIL